MGTSITCHALAGITTALKTCLSNVLSTTLPYGTIFGSVSALSLQKSLKKIHTYIQIYKYTNRTCFFYPYRLYDSGFAPSALSLRLYYNHNISNQLSSHRTLTTHNWFSDLFRFIPSFWYLPGLITICLGRAHMLENVFPNSFGLST